MGTFMNIKDKMKLTANAAGKKENRAKRVWVGWFFKKEKCEVLLRKKKGRNWGLVSFSNVFL